MRNHLAVKLEQYAAFSDGERVRLDALVSHRVKSYAPRETIIAEGEKVDHIYLITSGLAVRSKSLPDGGRQIMAFLIPGDLCDIEVFVLEQMDHDIIAVGDTTCALIPAREMEAMLSESSKLTKALWWSTMTDSAVLRERIVDHGRRDSRERIAHLFYEMLIRYRVVELTSDDAFDFPITQQELADATGLTPVHANRTLQQLRDEGLIEFRNKRLRVLDPAGLKRAARFQTNYLHLTRTERGDLAVSDRAGDLVDHDRG
jgi:CRP-like cAMP-binding protein